MQHQSAKRPVAVTGTFDVQNYGDLLFPLIARHRLAPHGFDVVPATPTGQATGWQECLPPVTVASLPDTKALAGILIGGGNIAHAGTAHLPQYSGVHDRTAYPSLWLGASLIGSMLNLPIVWNAPGVPRALSVIEDGLARHALSSAEYVSVRDQASAEFLGAASTAQIVPDTACDLSVMWPRSDLRPVFQRLLAERGWTQDSRWMTVHIKGRSIADTPTALAAQIDAFAAVQGVTPILLALAPCHGDDLAVRNVSLAMRGAHLNLSDVGGLREIAAAIAHADLHLGPSLHGYITAAAYDVPSALITVPDLPKFAGFLSHIERPQDAVPSWTEAFTLGEHLLHRAGAPVIPQGVHDQLDAHWGRVVAGLTSPELTPLQRTRFARIVLQRSLSHGGFDGLLSPLLG